MNMMQYRDFHFADSDRLNFADKKSKQEAEAAAQQLEKNEEELQQRLERGEITQSWFYYAATT